MNGITIDELAELEELERDEAQSLVEDLLALGLIHDSGKKRNGEIVFFSTKHGANVPGRVQ